MSGNSAFRQPHYLGESPEPSCRVRCAVHGFIRFSEAERKVIDHRLFRRLRFIRQLALTELVYPGATHTRFEHSLGVMEMSTRIFDRLAAESGAEMEETFAEVEQLRDNTMAKARQICRLAGLLHDVGHCCFSHAAEDVIHKDSDHEALTAVMLRTPDLLQQLIDDTFFPGCAELASSLIKRQPNSPPQLQILRDIVSGQVDADRSDYLLRDSHHCGVDYGRFDHRRLIECLTGWKDEETGEMVIGIKRDGIHSFEALILARYQMNTQVYYHRLRRIYDCYLREYFRTFDRTEFDSTDKVLAWNDIRAMHRLIEDAGNPGSAGHEWARRIINRDHHRDVFSLDEGDGPQAVKTARKVLRKIREERSDVDFIEDLPDEPFSIHKIARDDDREARHIDFPLMEQGRRTSLGERSQILKTLPPTFRVGFIFANAVDRENRRGIAERCRTLKGELS